MEKKLFKKYIRILERTGLVLDIIEKSKSGLVGTLLS